jgi:DNA-binding CsgD family transcriptional regulator
MSTMLQESPPVLTQRQRQVVELIAKGRSNEEIGALLGISARTARAHADILREKLAVRRREIPLAYRRRTGLDPFAASSA